MVTSPKAQDVILTQPYVCQIRSKQHIEVRALESGSIEEILMKEGQEVKKGYVMFKILPILHRAKYEADLAEYRARGTGTQLHQRFDSNMKRAVSPNKVAL